MSKSLWFGGLVNVADCSPLSWRQEKISIHEYDREVVHHCGSPTIKLFMIEGEMSIGFGVWVAMNSNTGVLALCALPLLLKELNVFVLCDISGECFWVNTCFLILEVSCGNDGE